MSTDEAQLKEFADIVMKSYSENSILSGLTNLIEYTNQTNEFFQIGERNYLPKEFFSTDNKLDNTPLAGQIGISVALGELNFLTYHIIARTEKKEIKKVGISNFSDYQIADAVMRNIEKPTDIFIPIDWPFYNEVQEWAKIGMVKFENSGTYLIISGNRIKIHWSSKYTPLEKIIVLRRGGIKIIQKTFKNIRIPKELKNVLYSYGDRIRMDFAQSEKESDFDFYVRSVLAIESIDEDSVCVIELPKAQN